MHDRGKNSSLIEHKQLKVQDNETVANHKASKQMDVTFAEVLVFILLIEVTLILINAIN